MTINEILNLGHISSSEVPNYTRIQTEEGYYMTAWTEGDDIRKYAGSNVYYLPVRENYDYPDLRVITTEEHERLSAERDAELEINPLIIVLKPQEKSVTITSNGDTIVTPDEGFNGLTEVNISVEVVSSGGSGLDVPFEEIGYTTELKNEVNNKLNIKPFSDLEYSKSLYNKWNPNLTSIYNLYKDDDKLVYAPNVDTSNVKDMYSLFANCRQLTTVPLLNTSKVKDMRYMFEDCYQLTSIPHFDTSSATDMNHMFYGCYQLTTVPLLNTSNVTDMSSMFEGCYQLTTVPLLNTSNVTNMRGMFRHSMSLSTVPLFDTSNVTNMSSMFEGCSNLTTIPQFNTSNVTKMDYMFQYCSSLVSLPLLDFSKVTDIYYIFGMFELRNLTDVGGFKNFGMQPTLTLNSAYQFNNLSNITYESAMNIINNLYDRASAGYSVITLKFASKTLDLLSSDDISIATNKGWTITV